MFGNHEQANMVPHPPVGPQGATSLFEVPREDGSCPWGKGVGVQGKLGGSCTQLRFSNVITRRPPPALPRETPAPVRRRWGGRPGVPSGPAC